MNKLILAGKVVKEDPTLSYTSTGVAKATINLMVKKSFAKKDSENKNDFFLIDVWQKKAEYVAKYVKKDTMVVAECRIENNNYEKDGKMIYGNRIVCENIERMTFDETFETQVVDNDDNIPF